MSHKANPRGGASGRTARPIVETSVGDDAPAGQRADFTIHARVRQVLTRRWVRTDGLEVGTTDGVVVIKGSLDREPGGFTVGSDPAVRERFIKSLTRELKGIPGVTEVVLELRPSEGGTP